MKLAVTFDWLNGSLSFKKQKISNFDVESKNTSKIKLRMIWTKNVDMSVTFKMLLNLRTRNRPIWKMHLIFNFILADNMEEDLKLEKLFLNGYLQIICKPHPILSPKSKLSEIVLQLKFFFLNNDFIPSIQWNLYSTSKVNILGLLALHRCFSY